MLDLDYALYDLAGNIRTITDAGGTGRDRSYAYDEFHQLTGASGGLPSETYAYDAVGNRTARTVGAATHSLVYSDSGNTAQDDRGGGAVLDLAWDSAGRLVSVSQGAAVLGEYLHNAMGQRVAKTVGAATTHFLYDLSGRLVGEADGATGAATAEYVWLEGMPLAFITGGAVYYVHADHLGTPQRLTDGAKAVVWDAAYAPFGRATASGSVAFNLRFPGQYEDAETGLHYNYFRDYDPELGRYVQSDPIGLRGGWNAYGYVGGNPVALFDFFGLEPECKLESVVATEERTETGTRYGQWKLSDSQRDGTDFAGKTADGNYWVLNCAWKRRVTEFARYLQRQVVVIMRICYECGREVSAAPVGEPKPLGPWQVVSEHSATRVQKHIDTVKAALWRGDQQARAFSACQALSSYPTGIY